MCGSGVCRALWARRAVDYVFVDTAQWKSALGVNRHGHCGQEKFRRLVSELQF
jgi:hypothetical protein